MAPGSVLLAPLMPRAALPTPRPGESELDTILRTGAIHAVYQPVVDLETGDIVAYEALARGPAGSPLETPIALFGAAALVGRQTELDWACRLAAVEGALTAELPPSVALFINVEPASLGTPIPGAGQDLIDRAQRELRIVIELTERALAARPADLLATVSAVRERGWAVALDDVGAVDTSAALMPLLRPDIIKLDLALIQNRPTSETAAAISAVIAEAERTGAVVLAEGIETSAHEQTARAFGASLGQGWRYGHPGALPSPVVGPRTPLAAFEQHDRLPPATPIDAVFPGRRPRIAAKADLLSFSQHLERWASAVPDGAVVLAALQDTRFLSARTRARFADLAARSPLVALFGTGLTDDPLPGARGVRLADADPLRGQWDVVVLGPHFAGALVARDLDDDLPDMERRFEYVITFDRDAVIAAARSLLVRITPRS